MDENGKQYRPICPDDIFQLSGNGYLFFAVDILGLIGFILCMGIYWYSQLFGAIALLGFMFILFLFHNDSHHYYHASPQLRFCLLFTNKKTKQIIMHVESWANSNANLHQSIVNPYFKENIKAINLLIFANRKDLKNIYSSYTKQMALDYISIYFKI